MTYRELLELYKMGKLEESKKSEVEADIEKHEAITDFLYEDAEIPELEASLEYDSDSIEDKDILAKQEQDFMKMIRRSIRKAFLKMGGIICVVIFSALLFIQFALPKLVSSFYYNPGKQISENANQMSLDMAVYTELTMPGYVRENVSVEDTGYGNYNICIIQNFTRNDVFTNVSGKVERGKLTLYDVNILKRPTSNIFGWFQVLGDRSESLKEKEKAGQTIYSCAGNATNATSLLKGLDGNKEYMAYVTLDKMMNYNDFMKFVKKYKELGDIWCAVCTKDDSASGDTMFQADNIGFQCTLSSSTLLQWDYRNYPNLLLWDDAATGAANTNQLEKKMSQEDFMKKHFISMLRYMSNQKKFLSMMKENSYDYENAVEYIEKNGLTVYGFTTVADKKTLLKLNKQQEIYEIYTQPFR